MTYAPKPRGDHVPLALVADDDEATRKLLASCLEALGCRVLSAGDGVEVIEQLEALDARELEHPFLVVTDLDMPRCNGLAVLELIRQRFLFARVLIVTAFGDAGTRARARALGVEAVVDKPFRLRDIGELATRYLGLPPPASVPRLRAAANDTVPPTRRSGC